MKRKNAAVGRIFIIVRIILYLLVAAALFYLGRNAYSFGYKVFAEETVSDPPGKKVSVSVVEDGMSASELSEMLEKKGLIKDSRVFWVQMQLSNYKDKIKAGTYILNTSQTSEEMLAILSGTDESESESEE